MVDEYIKESITAINSQDINKAISYYTDDCVYEDIAIGRVNRGKGELKAFFQEMFNFSSDLQFELKSIFSDGDLVASEWIMSGTHTGATMGIPATGKQFSIRGASVSQTYEGKVSKQTDYWNLMSFLEQTGLLPGTSPNWFGRLIMRLMMKR